MPNFVKTKQIIAQDRKYFAASGRIHYYDLVVDKAHGSIITDVDGNEYIDLLSSAGALNIGHTPSKVVEAITKQTNKMIHYTPAYMYHEPLAKLAEKLVSIAPGNSSKQVSFGLSGSDANDAIIKFARGYTGRQNIISFVNAYHGSSYGSISLSAITPNMRRKIGPLVPSIHHIPFPDSYRGMYNNIEANTVDEYLAPLLLAFETYLPPDEVACIIVETLQGDGGLLVPQAGYLQKLYEICQKYGILFAVDDVQQGMGRTGKWFSSEHFGIEPDLMSVGKSLASGLPLSAVVGKTEIMQSLGAPAHLFTTGANPVCCEAALATIETIEQDNVLEHTQKMEEFVFKRTKNWREKYPIIGDIRGLGLSIAIDIVKDQKTKEKNATAALKICNRLFEKGILMISFAKNVLRFQPPLIITEAELEIALTKIEDTIVEELAGKIPDDIIANSQGW